MTDLTDHDRRIIRNALRHYASLNSEFATAAAQKNTRMPDGMPWPKNAAKDAIAISQRAFDLIDKFADIAAAANGESK